MSLHRVNAGGGGLSTGREKVGREAVRSVLYRNRANHIGKAFQNPVRVHPVTGDAAVVNHFFTGAQHHKCRCIKICNPQVFFLGFKGCDNLFAQVFVDGVMEGFDLRILISHVGDFPLKIRRKAVAVEKVTQKGCDPFCAGLAFAGIRLCLTDMVQGAVGESPVNFL